MFAVTWSPPICPSKYTTADREFVGPNRTKNDDPLATDQSAFVFSRGHRHHPIDDGSQRFIVPYITDDDAACSRTFSPDVKRCTIRRGPGTTPHTHTPVERVRSYAVDHFRNTPSYIPPTPPRGNDDCRSDRIVETSSVFVRTFVVIRA